jgi:glycosyltransferase involved in cell wall biosynthesis
MMKIAILSPVAWRTPPRHYGPWERFVSLLSEGLIERGLDVTVFATGDSLTTGKLEWICEKPYEEDPGLDAKVCEALHIGYFFESASAFDLLHNNFDFLPLTFSRLVNKPMLTTIHGFSSDKILPVYEKYNNCNYYVSISDADRNPRLNYLATIYHGIDISEFDYREDHGSYLLYFGRIHPDKGTAAAITIAQKTKMPLKIAGIIQDKDYFKERVLPYIDNQQIVYLGSVGPEERNKLLGGAYALLHPINFDEPFGLSVIEAMACGTPVIAYKRGSIPEVIKDGETGFLMENVEDAIERIKDIPRLSRQNCRRWVESNFSREIMVDRYIKIYRQIIG